MTIPARDIPMTIIGGYLGAGKTTTINQLLSKEHGQRLAILVNDFGALNIDVDLIDYHEGNTYGLSNGCVCCSITDDLGTTLADLTNADNPPDQIILETSGVAEPAKLAVYCDGWPGISLQSIIIIVDAETIKARSRNKFVGQLVCRQLLAADLLILNKSDLVNVNELADLRVWIKEQGVHAEILETQHGAVPLEFLLAVTNKGNHKNSETPNNYEHDHGDAFYSLTVEDQNPWHRENLVAALETMPSHLIRVKGVVSLVDEGSVESHLLQMVGRRHSIQKSDEKIKQRTLTRLALVGINRNADLDEIEKRLKSCADHVSIEGKNS